MVIEELQRACQLNSSIHADGVFRKYLGCSDWHQVAGDVGRAAEGALNCSMWTCQQFVKS